MEADEVAKKLLEGKNCNNCVFFKNGICRRAVKDSEEGINFYENENKSPEDNTCENWKTSNLKELRRQLK